MFEEKTVNWSSAVFLYGVLCIGSSYLNALEFNPIVPQLLDVVSLWGWGNCCHV